MSASPKSPMEPEMIATRANGEMVAPRGQPLVWGMDGTRTWWVALGVASVALIVAYAPNLVELSHTWSNDPNYGHGFLVVPIALVILWRRLDETPWREPREIATSPWWGWGLLLVVLALRELAYEWSFQWLETITLLPACVCLAWAFGGWSLLRRVGPSIMFLVFMFPLPTAINGLITLPLQRIAATGSYFLLQVLGFWVVQQGNVLFLTTPFGTRSLDVALACSGLKMLMTLAATVVATILLVPLPLWKRLVLLVSAVPIALVSNMARIVATGLCYYYIHGRKGMDWAHDISGWMMMPLALVLVGLELKLLSWAIPPVIVPEDDRKTVLPLLAGKKPGGPTVGPEV